MFERIGHFSDREPYGDPSRAVASRRGNDGQRQRLWRRRFGMTQPVTTETVTRFIWAKDEFGNLVKLAVLT